ncbi:hypothetical protein TNCV_398041 [Trichonephila clavipes]|nr:hypothetical protein TNCV_398041 [Trichonephila clavipes]
MGGRAFNESLRWELQGRSAIYDGRGTLTIGRAARLLLGGRVARKKRGNINPLFVFCIPELPSHFQEKGVVEEESSKFADCVVNPKEFSLFFSLVVGASSEAAEVPGILLLFGAPEKAAAKERFGVTGLGIMLIKLDQLASLDKNNALQEIKLRLPYLQGKSTTMSVIAHQTEKEWISVNEKSRQRMSQTQAEGAAEQHAARLEDAHLLHIIRVLQHQKDVNQKQHISVKHDFVFGLAIHQNDHQARRRFVEWAQNEVAVVLDFHKRILFSDEAHFWLNGYVNKQNCRIWSEANPQVYVETPLHPEKLTVWCALCAGGILLQKR